MEYVVIFDLLKLSFFYDLKAFLVFSIFFGAAGLVILIGRTRGVFIKVWAIFVICISIANTFFLTSQRLEHRSMLQQNDYKKINGKISNFEIIKTTPYMARFSVSGTTFTTKLLGELGYKARKTINNGTKVRISFASSPQFILRFEVLPENNKIRCTLIKC